jgi:hypothetical protein
MLPESCKRYQAEGRLPMMSPHTHVALKYLSDEESARKAARRPDALPEPDEVVAEPAASARRRGHLGIPARLHLTPARHA